MEKVCDALGLPGTPEALSALAKAVAVRSAGWPMHVHNYLRGIWEALARQDVPSFDGIDAEEALAKGDEFRKEYYNERIVAAGAPVEIIRTLLREIARGEEKGRTKLSEDEATAVIERALDAMEEGPEKRLARRRVGDGIDGVQRMIRAGLVSIDKERRCSSPIPTLFEFVFSAEAGDGPPRRRTP